MADMTAGHRFTETSSSGRPKCGVCGLVWRDGQNLPPITCPKRPLDEVFEGWGRKYG